MNKKKVILISIIIVIVIVIIITSIYHNNKIYKNYEKQLEDKIEKIYNDINSYDYKGTGHIDLVANYRGAHGEANPANFNYDFNLTNTSLTLGNSDGYYTIGIPDDYKTYADNSIKELSSYTIDDYKNILSHNIKVENNKNKLVITLDKDYINELFNSNFSSIKLTFNLKGLLYKNVDNITLNIKYTYDGNNIDNNLTISSDLKTIIGEINNLDFRYYENSNGFSISYDTLFKLNKIEYDNYNEINIVFSSYSATLDLYKDYVDFYVSGEAAIYKGLTMKITFDDNININKANLIDGHSIPIVRYFTNLNRVGSEY